MNFRMFIESVKWTSPEFSGSHGLFSSFELLNVAQI